MDPYLDKSTGILKNKLNITSAEDLKTVERRITKLRSRDLAEKPVKGNFDLKHLQQIHKTLFGDIYNWAGQIRTVNIAKGDTMFAIYGFIDKEFAKLAQKLKEEKHLKGLPIDKFCNRAAWFMGEINIIHPFREGNGRTQREFIGQLAHQAGFHIKWEGISHQDMINASIESGFTSHDHLAALLLKNTIMFKELGLNEQQIKQLQDLEDAVKNAALALDDFKKQKSSDIKLYEKLANQASAARYELDMFIKNGYKPPAIDNPKQSTTKARGR